MKKLKTFISEAILLKCLYVVQPCGTTGTPSQILGFVCMQNIVNEIQ